ncbi:hypothetical protein MVEN_02543200 [Mycena venus]|uniref:Uncharacterized protein n=1 Tax=Mycena venus TaxID=2733690 RepID=A0A8H6U526_9AGAR|nr:hypothetical protein MVEN_02543200 [Mycena venus]
MDTHWTSRRCQDLAIAIKSRNARPPRPDIHVASGILPAVHGDCVGAYFKWEVGSLFKTYPFVIHDPKSRHKPRYTLLSAEFVTSIIRVRSLECSGSILTTHGCCDACEGLDSAIEIVENWSQQSFGKKSIDRLNHGQLEAKLKVLSRQLRAEQITKSNHWISLKAARKRLDDYNRLFDLLFANQVPRLPRLLSTAKKEGWSTTKTAEKSQLAIDGKYHPRNYTEFDRDLAILMYELGGAAALHALNKALIMLPSRRTIVETRREMNLRITVGDVKVSEILENIEILFSDINTGDRGPVLHTLSQDEIAGDGRLCYLEETDEIAGLCEHATSRLKTFKMGDDLSCIEEVIKAIRAGDIHVGKEFSVAAFARHAPDDYGAKPVLLMPTCKKGSWQSSARILQKLIQAWKLSPFGEAKHGPLQEIASDGDGRRRAALYLVCMHKRLGPDDPIYQFLSDLPGLNLYTGEDGITMCFDPKHLFKRMSIQSLEFITNNVGIIGLCTLLCSLAGILLNGVIINKTLVAQWLEKIPGHDWSDQSIHALLNPKDPQDVGRATKLLCLVPEMRHLDTSDLTPAEKNTHRALSLLGEMFHALIDPFINPTLSLSEQMIQLVKFAHMACALFVKHDGDFSHQLYGDLQCMVKSMIFKIVHSKVLNPLLKVFLCLLGDDVLETLFGRSRMVGGHSPNHAIDELRHRFCSALRMDKIFQKYPWLERRPRHLQLIRSRDVDHLSPRQWEGDLTAGSVDIRACYLAGVSLARGILAKFGCDMDFTARFAPDDVDLMRPNGGKCPGLSKEVDRSLVDASTAATESLSSSASNESLKPADILAFNAKVALATEKAAHTELDARANPEAHSIWINLTEDGQKKAHKKTILRTSHDRLLRVRYFSTGGDSWDRTASAAYSKSTADDHLFKIQGLFATLVCFNTAQVSLAILQCKDIKIVNTHPIKYLEAAPTAEISLPDTRYEISGQILSLVPYDESHDSSGKISWAWAAQFVAFESPKSKQASTTDVPARMRHLSVTVDGRLVLPLTTADLKQVTLEEILNISRSTDTESESEKTWVFSNSQLEAMGTALVERVQEEEVRLKIPVYGVVKEVTIGTTKSILHSFNAVTAPAAKDNRRPCCICQKNVAGPDRQNHMGKHILFAQRGVVEANDTVAEVSKKFPCGFCGKEMSDRGCTISIVSGKAISSCPERYQFQVKAALKSSSTKPCTNAPLKCSLCPETHWKYNMLQHLQERHPTWQVTMPQHSGAFFPLRSWSRTTKNVD